MTFKKRSSWRPKTERKSLNDLQEVKVTESENVAAKATGNEQANPDEESKELLEEAKTIAKTMGRIPRENAIVCTAPGEQVDVQYISQRANGYAVAAIIKLTEAIESALKREPWDKTFFDSKLTSLWDGFYIDSIADDQAYRVEKTLFGEKTLHDKQHKVFHFNVKLEITAW